MPVIRRQAERGSLHHVINRGIARRTVLETRRDCRFQLSLYARAVHRRWIEFEEFAWMTTHFHALVRCLDGDLSRSIGWIEQHYVRWFNRGRRRDGPLYRARFVSSRIWTPPHERATRLYILENPVVARLAARPEDYPWCSAAFRARRKPPLWLARRRPIVPWASDAARAAGRWLVDRSLRFSRAAALADAGESLLGAAPAAVRAWMERKARLADGTAPGVPIAAPAMVDLALGAAVPFCDRGMSSAPRGVDDRLPVRAFLLRSLAGLRWNEIARHCRVPRSTAVEAAARHQERARGDASYRAWATGVAQVAIAESLGETERERRVGAAAR